jgi:hypothetical protein
MVFNATFNNISVLFGENQRPVGCCKSLIKLHRVYLQRLAMSGIRTHNFSGDRYLLHKFICHMIMTTSHWTRINFTYCNNLKLNIYFIGNLERSDTLSTSARPIVWQTGKRFRQLWNNDLQNTTQKTGEWTNLGQW